MGALPALRLAKLSEHRREGDCGWHSMVPRSAWLEEKSPKKSHPCR
jgi:hypothetical protein